jgi:hypothetical protein
MKLLISTWSPHLNHLLYSYFYYCKIEGIIVDIIQDKGLVYNGGLLLVDGKTIFFDYSDDTDFIERPDKFNYYFKRSLRSIDIYTNVYPLNFHVGLSYKSYSLLRFLNNDILFDKWSRIEVLKALDVFGLVFSASHSAIDIRRYPLKNNDSGGKVLFYTRLWNPDNHPDQAEKERRRLQNDFRINACRIIKKNYRNASVGLFLDELAKELAPDLLLSKKESLKNNYLNSLLYHDIGIADDGLKDTPGWKIGEYLLYGKAIISTPLNIKLDNFYIGKNYEELSNRTAYQEIPGKIEDLLKGKRYLDMGDENKEWSDYYIHPKNYIKRILTKI